MPTFRSEMTQPGANGMAAQAMKASTKLISGASKNTTLSDPAGTTISFSTNLKKSANDCSRPNGPTTFGPLRICTAAQILRSASSRKARLIRIPTVTSRMPPAVIRVQPSGVVQKLSVILGPRPF